MNKKKIFDNKAISYISLKGINKRAIIPSRWIGNTIQVNNIYCTMSVESLDLNDVQLYFDAYLNNKKESLFFS